MTTKDKLNEALGISGKMTLDEMLDDLDIHTDEVSDQLAEIGKSIESSSNKIDEKARELQRSSSAGILAIGDLNQSLSEIEGLVNQAKQVFQHIVDNITASDLLDSELVHAASSFLESIHLNVAEFISVYKAKTKFVEKVKLMLLQQEQRKELMAIKHKYDLELVEAKNTGSGDANVVEASNMVSFNTDDITKMLDGNNEKDEEDEEEKPENT